MAPIHTRRSEEEALSGILDGVAKVLLGDDRPEPTPPRCSVAESAAHLCQGCSHLYEKWAGDEACPKCGDRAAIALAEYIAAKVAAGRRRKKP
jgi:rubrerythrin